jgi:hypothetical protein
VDVNGDGRLDVVCHFDNVAAKWSADDFEGTIKGKMKDGKAFKGHGKLKVVPKQHD